MADKILSRAQAREQGLKRFFTGLPCVNGHVAERHTSNRECVVCKQAHDARRAVSSQKRAGAARFRERNRQKLSDWFKAHYAANRERIRQRQKTYNAKTSARNVRRAVAWNKLNPESKRTAVRNRRARQRGNGGSHTAADVAALLRKQGWCCRACHADVRATGYHVDHDVPISRGGSNGKENLQILCPSCNFQKRDMTMVEFERAKLAQ